MTPSIEELRGKRVGVNPISIVFKLSLRQTEGFLWSVGVVMGVDLEAPDHTTLSRRSQHFDFALNTGRLQAYVVTGFLMLTSSEKCANLVVRLERD